MKKISDFILLFATFFVGLANIFYPRAITIDVRYLNEETEANLCNQQK